MKNSDSKAGRPPREGEAATGQIQARTTLARKNAYVRALVWFRLKRQCAWCRRWLGGNPVAATVSHGICPVCMGKQRAEIARIRGERPPAPARRPDPLLLEIIGFALCAALLLALLLL